MSALEAFMTVAGIVVLGIGIRIGFDFSRHRRLSRMAAALKLSANGRVENAHPGVPAPHAGVETPGVRISLPTGDGHHTGTGHVRGDATDGAGVIVRAMPDPQRCVRFNHFHLHIGNMLCEACFAQMDKEGGVS